MCWAGRGIAVESIPETSCAERVVADVLAIGASVVVAERVRASVPLWFHTFALAPGVYTPGIARATTEHESGWGSARVRACEILAPWGRCWREAVLRVRLCSGRGRPRAKRRFWD